MKTILWQVILLSSTLLIGHMPVMAQNAAEPNVSEQEINTTDNQPEPPPNTTEGDAGETANGGGDTPATGGNEQGSDNQTSDASDTDSSADNANGTDDQNNNDTETDSGDSDTSTGNSDAEDTGSNDNADSDNNSDSGDSPSIPLDQADNTAQTAPQTAVMIDLELTDEEVDRYFLPEEPEPFTNGEVVDNFDGTVTYTPEPDFHGIDTFTYTVLDVVTDRPNKRVVKVEVSNEVDAGGPASCQVYAVHDQDNSDSQILTIDTYGGGYKTMPLGPLHRGYDIEGIGIHPQTHELYGISGWDRKYAAQRTYGTLYKINSHTGKLVTIGATGYKDISSLAFNPQDGSLWAFAGYDHEPQGIINVVDLDTGASRMALEFRADADSVEGLAWNQDGTILYGSQGKTLLSYAYRNGELKATGVTCPNMLAGTPDSNDPEVEIEALETMLIADRLMLSINRPSSTDLYEFDVASCRILPERTLNYETNYPDVESIAWPLDCQPKPQVESLEVNFAGKQNALFCPKRPRWITIKGKLFLEPTEGEVYVQTGWKVAAPTDIDCNAGENCVQGKHDQQLLAHKEQFEIRGWWPGLPAEPTESARVRFNIGIQDTAGNVINYYGEISKILYGSVEACDAAAAERAAAKDAAEQEAETEQETDEEQQDEAEQADSVEDAEASDGPATELTDKQQQLKTYLMNEQGATSVKFDGNNLYALIGNDLHHGVLSSLSAANRAFDDTKLMLRNGGEPDQNGYVSFMVIYPSVDDSPSERDLLQYEGVLTLDSEQAEGLEQLDNDAADAETDDTAQVLQLLDEAERVQLFAEYLTQQLNATEVVIDGNTMLALLGAEQHKAVLGKMLDPVEEPPRQLELLPKGRHFHIVYPDGQKQLLVYQGIVATDEENESNTLDNESNQTAEDNGSNVEESEPSEAAAEPPETESTETIEPVEDADSTETVEATEVIEDEAESTTVPPAEVEASPVAEDSEAEIVADEVVEDETVAPPAEAEVAPKDSEAEPSPANVEPAGSDEVAEPPVVNEPPSEPASPPADTVSKPESDESTS